MDSTTLQQLFEEICEFKITRYQAQSKLLVLARAIWHNDFIPNLFRLKEDTARRRGAYLIDFFSRFPVLSDKQANKLRKQLGTNLRQQLPSVCPNSQVTFYPDDVPGYDEVAHLWGLANGLRPSKVPGLLNLQRRAYLSSNQQA
jgi:hypothetical protein